MTTKRSEKVLGGQGGAEPPYCCRGIQFVCNITVPVFPCSHEYDILWNIWILLAHDVDGCVRFREEDLLG